MKMNKIYTMAMIVFLTNAVIQADQSESTSLLENPQTTYEPGLHLLVDPDVIVESNGITTFINQPTKHPDPVLISSWVPYRLVCAWGNVIREPNGLFRMWYLDMTAISPHDQAARKVWGDGIDYGFYPQKSGDCRDTETCFICYAESWDGVHWNKPILNLIEFEGSTQNNIVYSGQKAAEKTNGALTNMDGCTVIRDDNEPDPNKRYKMFAFWETVHKYDNSATKLNRPAEDIKRFRKALGHYVCYSPDGIHFGDLEPSGLPMTGRDRNCVMPDRKHAGWRAFVRPEIPDTEFIKYIRAVGLTTSTDLRHWSELETVLVPDERDEFGAAQQIHSFIPFNYGNEDLGFALISNFRGMPSTTYLACRQPDGIWKRVYRDQPYLPFGGAGTFDRGLALPLQNEPVIVGDQMYIYYTAAPVAPNHPSGRRSIGLAIARRDAFVGIAGGVGKVKSKFDTQEEAYFITRPITVSAPRLAVNVEGGSLRIALLDENKTPIPGYTLEDCIPISADNIREPVTWKNNKDLAPLIGKPVSIQANMVNSTVYAFRFCK